MTRSKENDKDERVNKQQHAEACAEDASDDKSACLLQCDSTIMFEN